MTVANKKKTRVDLILAKFATQQKISRLYIDDNLLKTEISSCPSYYFFIWGKWESIFRTSRLDLTFSPIVIYCLYFDNDLLGGDAHVELSIENYLPWDTWFYSNELCCFCRPGKLGLMKMPLRNVPFLMATPQLWKHSGNCSWSDLGAQTEQFQWQRHTLQRQWDPGLVPMKSYLAHFNGWRKNYSYTEQISSDFYLNKLISFYWIMPYCETEGDKTLFSSLRRASS